MRKKHIFLKSIVAISLLLSMMVSLLLGMTNAEYLKSLSKKFDIELKPDLVLEYFLRDTKTYKNDPRATENKANAEYRETKGVYKNAESFIQPITLGRDSSTEFSRTDLLANKKNSYFYTGSNLVYQVKIPVTEEGYYILDFTVDFLLGAHQDPWEKVLVFDSINTTLQYNHPDDSYYEDNFFSIIYQKAIGCEILTESDGIKFGSTDPFRLKYRTSAYDTETTYTGYTGNDNDGKSDNKKKEEMFYSDSAVLGNSDTIKDSVYQWKTLTPSRQERVKLAFKVSEEDVNNGYVIWAWDFEGLTGGHNYRLRVENLSVEKTMDLDGKTNSRSDSDPFFLFPQTSFVNTQHYHYNANNSNTQGNGKDRSSNVPGKTHSSGGRGTYVTEATANSLGMRAEMVYKSVNTTNGTKWNEDNPIGIYIPLKNVKYDRTYKVTFDFSVARQGKKTGDELSNSAYNEVLDPFLSDVNFYDYADFEDIFYSKINRVTPFQSYLYSGLSPQSTNAGHDTLKQQITYANKLYDNAPLTKYDQVTIFNTAQEDSFTKFPNYTTSSTVNDTYSINTIQGNLQYNNKKWYAHDSTQNRNFFNAIQRIEDNGQVSINWITFYNTTFSFNIPAESNDIDINNLYWIWQIDALVYTGFYNLRIDNVRIQEVVEYTSQLSASSDGGIKIGGTSVIPSRHATNYGKGINTSTSTNNEGDPSIFNNFKGWNSTGQNYQVRAYDSFETEKRRINTSTGETVTSGGELLEVRVYKPTMYMVNGNIYAPTVDARKLPVAPGGGNGQNDYKIALSGWAVLKGGVEKYVWSADGGVTWYDMTFEGTSDSSVLSTAERGIDQKTIGQSQNQSGGADYITFTQEDAKNNSFNGFTLVADLKGTKYEHQHDLDIIIAAVPCVNANFRCEIVRIINYHSTNHYASQIEEISSDITSSGGSISKLTADLSITSGTSYNANVWYSDHYPVSARGVFSHNTDADSKIDYSKLQTTCSDIPIKNKLKVSGGIVCYGGVYEYVYSVDGGKTWTKIQTNTGTLKYGNGKDQIYEKILYQWVTHSDGNDSNYFAPNGAFNGSANNKEGKDARLNIDLSAYEGQIVDVIVAAKPNFQYASANGLTDAKTDIYLPVAKIDNVAVYGENGTFYSRIHTVYVDRNSASRRTITPVNEDPIDKSYLNCSDNFATTNKGGAAEIGSGFAYTIFEINNVNPRYMRFYNNSLNEMMSGGKITIDGYVMCHGGVKQYKFSLDGGEQWTVINDAGIDITSSAGSMYANSKMSDSTFALPDDGRKGDFCCTSPATDYKVGDYSDDDVYFQHALEFSLPALPAGSQRNLLVVAEGNIDSDGDGEGNLYPVLAMKLKFKYKDGKSSQYGYYRSTKRNGTAATDIRSGWFSLNQSWSFTPKGGATDVNDNNTFNRMTIPVTQDGDFNLNLSHNMLSASTDKTWVEAENRYKVDNNQIQLYKYNGDSDYDGTIVTSALARAKLFMDRKHFVQGEAIEVDWSLSTGATFDKDALTGVTISIVSAEWKNSSGNRHALQVRSIPAGSHPSKAQQNKTGSVTFQYDPDKGFNAGLPQHLRELPPGKYSIIMINHGTSIELQWGDKDSKTGKTNDRYKSWELARMDDIYIHPSDASLDITVLHDEGDETCFSNVNQLFNYSTEDDRIAGRYTGNPFVNSEITIPITVTEADVKRGYIILDINYTELLYKSIKAPDEVTSGDKTTITVKRPGEKDQVHTKYPFTSVSYRAYPTLGTTPLVKRTS